MGVINYDSKVNRKCTSLPVQYFRKTRNNFKK